MIKKYKAFGGEERNNNTIKIKDCGKINCIPSQD
jgi:hypothetical protein